MVLSLVISILDFSLISFSNFKKLEWTKKSLVQSYQFTDRKKVHSELKHNPQDNI